MKNYIVPVLFTFVLVACNAKTNEAPNAESQRNDLPNMEITLLNGERLQARDLTGKVLLIMFFPDCSHCQDEAKAMQERLKAFDGYKVYYLSSVSKEEVNLFADDYKLSGKKNIKFGTVSGESVVNNFGPIPTPSVYVYNEKKLMKSFEGQTDIEVIISAL
jgi:hypothetical protein